MLSIADKNFAALSFTSMPSARKKNSKRKTYVSKASEFGLKLDSEPRDTIVVDPPWGGIDGGVVDIF